MVSRDGKSLQPHAVLRGTWASICIYKILWQVSLQLVFFSWGWDVPASIVHLKCISSLLLCSWFAFWLLADLLVILQGKKISAAQSVMWKKKLYLLPSFSLHSVCFLHFWIWYDVVRVTLAGHEKLFRGVVLVFWQKKFYLLSPWFQQTYGHCSMWVLSNCCADVCTFPRYCTWLLFSFNLFKKGYFSPADPALCMRAVNDSCWDQWFPVFY